MTSRFAALFLASATLFTQACGKNDDGSQRRKMEALEADLHRAEQREATIKGEVSRLTTLVASLQNDLKLLSEKPCDYDLDPASYTIKKKENGSAVGVEPPASMSQARSTSERSSALPSELKDVSARIRQARRGIKTCYQEAAKKNATLQTVEKRVQLVFDVKPTGQVTGVMVSPPVGFGFEGCVRRLLGSWSFSKFKGQPQRFRAWMNLRPT